ncbi:hypothetical protein ROJ8625_02391 [Roseivivax jejudonensis]|uniref:Uncharacterized protein n=1 Tax=Roseivivax jejudonensis TaxID=1529041 RepID=A0A1X6ZDY6_9RHOB|nr:hypothetical protein [Roseivivax jejudonensis]SLN48850.1 hypothetical protein ROJ8625_02391 [Roseivivax jejudonensis]
MFTPRLLLLAALAGIAGCIANSIAVSVLFGAPLWPLILSPGREFWSIVFALALVPIFARMAPVAAGATGFVVLNLLASVSAKLIWGAGAPWTMVFVVNGVYAIVAVAVYAAGREKALA